MGTPRILFISRAYPPVIGGIERQNFELCNALGELTEVRLIANTRGKRFLPVFFFLAFLRGLIAAPRCDVILLGDAVLAPLGRVLGILCRRPVCCIVHGLDITFANRWYQRIWVRGFLPGMSRLFAVGNATIAQATQRGINPALCRFIPNGVKLEEDGGARELNVPRVQTASGQFYLLTLGRLVPRKGVAWFVEHVMPSLPEHVHYWIAGEGPDRAEIEAAVAKLPDPGRVTVFGEVTEQEKRALLARANMFVQPNVPVAGDMEGFGLVVLEAAAAGLPVLASRLEGLADAIVQDKNGLLVEPCEAGAFVELIGRFATAPQDAAAFGQRAGAFVEENCQWRAIAPRYIEELRELIAKERL